jgi:integrase
MNLSEKSLLKLPIGKERAHFYDDEVRGFGVRVDPNGRRSFFWRAKIRGAVRFRALGEFPSISVKDARTAAKKFIGVAAAWKQSGFAGPDPFAKEQRVEPASVPTFQHLVDAYVERRVKEAANNPARAEYSVRWMTKKYFASWTQRPIDKIGVDDVLAVKNLCGEKKYISNRVVEFVRALYNWSAGLANGKVNFWRVENPAKDVECYKEKPRVRFLQPEELVRFNAALKEESSVDLKDFLTLALASGARRGEVLAAQWKNIQWEREVWTIPYSKNGEARDVSLLPAALDVFKRRRAEIPDSEEHVFPGVGKSGHLIDLKKPWNEFRKRANFPDVRLHDLRHTHASYMAISGVSLQQIGAALGHKNLQSTMVYSHLHEQAVRQARELGQSKMQEMTIAAKKRARLAARRPKLLAVSNV